MIGIQLIAITFALIALFFTYSNYRRKHFTKTEMVVWFLIWFGFVGVALFPQFFSPFVQQLGFSRLMDFVVIIAFVVLFSIIMHNYLIVHRLEKRIDDLVRKLALKKMSDHEND